MTLLGELTPVRRRRMQKGAWELLGEILGLSEEHDLPVIDWQVSEFALVGTLGMIDNGERRGVFDAWVDALELGRWDERPPDAGWIHLHAFTENWRGRSVNVAILADVDTEATS